MRKKMFSNSIEKTGSEKGEAFHMCIHVCSILHDEDDYDDAFLYLINPGLPVNGL